jgi:hypothetical protein
MASAPFTRSWSLAPVTVNSLLAVPDANSIPSAMAAARAFRFHTPGSIEADRFNGFAFPFSPLRPCYSQ